MIQILIRKKKENGRSSFLYFLDKKVFNSKSEGKNIPEMKKKSGSLNIFIPISPGKPVLPYRPMI